MGTRSGRALNERPDAGTDETLQNMLDGNRRYMNGLSTGLHRTALRRVEVAAGQHPFAAVIGCSDSRAPPELIFDVGLGDLFVVRSPGHVIDDVLLGSLEYAATQLGVRLFVVLGHTDCGAVKSALGGAPFEGHIPLLMKGLGPAVAAARKGQGDQVANGVAANLAMTVKKLRSAAPVLSRLVREGKLRVEGALYDLRTGEVRLTDPSSTGAGKS